MKRHRPLPLIAAVLVLFTVRPAAADTVVTGSLGRVFSGDVEEGVTSYGAAIGFMGDGILGFEVEGTYTPDFFGETPDGSNNITTLMGNILVGVPIGQSARIYATGGVGLMKFRVPDADEFFDIDRNDFGVNAGGGVFVYFGQRFGVRGDVRYFRDVRESTTDDFDVDLGGFHYWRGSVGVSLKF
jgi:opacity protein-like surface antigen